MGKNSLLFQVRPLTCHMYPFFKTTIKNFLNARMMYVKHCGGWISCSFALRPLLWQVSLFLFYKLTNSKKTIPVPHTNRYLVCSFIRNRVKKLTIISISTGNCLLWCLGVMCNIWHGPNYVSDLSSEVEQIVVFDYRSMSAFFIFRTTLPRVAVN